MSRNRRPVARPNRFAGACGRCSQIVPANEGRLVDSVSGWVVLHRGECPATTATVVEPGLYVAANGDFVKVVKSGYSGRPYAKRLSVREYNGEFIGGFVFDREIDITDANLSPVTAEAAAAAGLRWNICIRCAATLGGDTLAAKCSAVVGYGAVCAANSGWDYPRGVKAQRALLAQHGIAA